MQGLIRKHRDDVFFVATIGLDTQKNIFFSQIKHNKKEKMEGEKRKRTDEKEENKDKNSGPAQIAALHEMSLFSLFMSQKAIQKLREAAQEIGFSLAVHYISTFMSHGLAGQRSVLCAPGNSLSQSLVRVFFKEPNGKMSEGMRMAIQEITGKEMIDKFIEKVVISPDSKNIVFHTEIASFVDSSGNKISFEKRFLTLANSIEEYVTASDREEKVEGWIAYIN